MKRSFFVALAVLVLVSPGLLLAGCGSSGGGSHAEAAIIDQLYSVQPNQEFIDETTAVLNGYGFSVDLYQGDAVTVDLYRKLPSYGYKLIIFRAHAGLLSHEETSGTAVTRATCIFTNEPYTETAHVAEQLDGRLAKARVDEGYPTVFATGARFTTRSMEGQFKDTVIIMMGCTCLYLTDLARAFIDKGASSYLGWDDLVTLDYVDDATLTIIRKLFADKLTLEDTVLQTISEEGRDPYHGATLRYFPWDKGDQNVEDLL